MQPRFLVLRGGALGDLIVTLPVLAALRERWPDAWIELAGYPRTASLALAAGLVQRVESLDRAEVARLFSLRPAIPAEQAERLRSFHLVISFLYDPGDVVRRNMLDAGVKQVLYIDPRPSGRHAADHLFRVLEPLAMYAEGDIVPSLSVPAKIPEGFPSAAAAENAVAIHPGSGSPGKNWPLGKFLELAGIAAANGCGSPVFLFGEADAESRDAYRRAGAGWPVIEGLDICAVAGMLAACRGYVGNDSGISHLAAALGIPSVVLFGPSDPAVWGPRGRAVRLLRADPPTSEGMGGIAAKAVAEELARAMSGARRSSRRAAVST